MKDNKLGYSITLVDFDNNVMKYEGVHEWTLLTDVWLKLQDEEEVKVINIATIKEITII